MASGSETTSLKRRASHDSTSSQDDKEASKHRAVEVGQEHNQDDVRVSREEHLGDEHGEDEEDGEISSNASSPARGTTNEDTEPPLPDEEAPLPNEEPPLPNEEPPLPAEDPEDDGWAPVWDANAQAFYFYNRFTQATQWTNPRVPEASSIHPPLPVQNLAPGVSASSLPLSAPPEPSTRPAGGYDPSIHGDYDPNAWYAQPAEPDPTNLSQPLDPAAAYAATGAFNRFTGRWQAADLNPENFNDEAKSKRQMNAFFDVDAAANSHDGRSLKAERAGKKLSKKEVKEFKEKRKQRKEEKRRAWLRD
jgi:hypothetical protein